jgi:hypothetical protein
MKALPQAIAMPNIHIGIIAGKLNGVNACSDAERLAHRDRRRYQGPRRPNIPL